MTNPEPGALGAVHPDHDDAGQHPGRDAGHRGGRRGWSPRGQLAQAVAGRDARALGPGRDVAAEQAADQRGHHGDGQPGEGQPAAPVQDPVPQPPCRKPRLSQTPVPQRAGRRPGCSRSRPGRRRGSPGRRRHRARSIAAEHPAAERRLPERPPGAQGLQPGRGGFSRGRAAGLNCPRLTARAPRTYRASPRRPGAGRRSCHSCPISGRTRHAQRNGLAQDTSRRKPRPIRDQKPTGLSCGRCTIAWSTTAGGRVGDHRVDKAARRPDQAPVIGVDGVDLAAVPGRDMPPAGQAARQHPALNKYRDDG